jgi:hypothetical protein
MKRRSLISALSILLASGLLFSSCIGSFGLSNKLLSWNKGIDTKMVNELVFICLTPVYAVSMLADLLVLNTLEFWTGDNPVADAGSVRRIDTKDGVYTVETLEDGYAIRKAGNDQVVDLKYDPSDRSWRMETEGRTHKLFRFVNGDEVVVYLSGGRQMQVTLDQAGLLALRQVVGSYTHYAAR